MFFYVANWKMNMSFDKAIEFSKYHYDGFVDISKNTAKRIIICPSFPELKPLYDLFEDSLVNIGAQDCSSSKSGPYTSQIDAQSLQDIGCTYCIIGHSEKRAYCAENNEDIAQKVARLLEVDVEPIICVGEKKADYDVGNTESVVKTQLESILRILKQFIAPKLRLCIAYEPIWSIGTGKIPDNSYIEGVFSFIKDTFAYEAPNAEITVLYGGSVDENTAQQIKAVRNLGGFLIGSASLDFQKFEKIVNL